MHQFERPAMALQRRLHNHSAERAWDREILVVTRTDKLYPNTTNSAGWEEAITEDQIHHPAATKHKSREKLIKCKRLHNRPLSHVLRYHYKYVQTQIHRLEHQIFKTIWATCFTKCLNLYIVFLSSMGLNILLMCFYQSCMLGRDFSSWSRLLLCPDQHLSRVLT